LHLVPPTTGRTTAGGMTLGELYERYERHRALAPDTRTRQNYRVAWSGFVSYLRSASGREPTVDELTTVRVNTYLRHGVEMRGWSEQTTATYGGNLRSVVSGMRRHGLVPPVTLADFEVPRATRAAPQYFDELALARIFAHLEADRTSLHMRLRAVIQIMLDCGARPDEVASLRFSDLDRAQSQLHIRGKGAKYRRVPVGAFTWSYLDDYMRVRPRPEAADEAVFVTLRGPRKAVAAATIAADMRDVLVAVGLAGDRSKGGEEVHRLYTMRKTFAHRAAENGMDVGELAAIMGHSPNSIPMLLRVYYQPSDAQKRAAHAAARPADSLHEWRATGAREREVAEPTYFERWAAPPHSTDGGSRPSSTRSSRSRSKGEYRRASPANSAWLTGA
jgi:integrase